MPFKKFKPTRDLTRELLLGSIFTFFFFVALVYFGYIKMKQTESSTQWVNHTMAVLNQIQEVEAKLYRLVNARRTYFITRDERDQNEFEESSIKINNSISELELLVQDQKKQLLESKKIRDKINELIVNYSQTFDINVVPKVRPTKTEILLSDAIKSLNEMKRVEEGLLKLRLNDSSEVLSKANFFFLFSAITGSLIILVGLSTIGSELKKRRQVQNELYESLVLQNTMLNNTPYALFAINEKGEIALFNAAATNLLGYNKDEVIGKSPTIFHRPHELHQWSELLSARFGSAIHPDTEVLTYRAKHGISETDQWTLVRKDNSSVPVHLSYAALRKEDGTLLGYIALAFDITSQLEYEEAMIKAREEALAGTRAKSEFLANMSHEIRTPMNAIMGMADLLAETKLDEEQERYVDIFKKAGESLLAIINDILDLSKIEARHFQLDHASFNLKSTISKVIEIMAIKAHQKNLELVVDLDHELRDTFYGDPNRLTQVLLNLIGNSIKFTQRGEVFLSIKAGKRTEHDQEIIFQVKDTGIGMSTELQNKIFERFFQGDSSATREYGGTGLGLNISQRLIELMRGSVSVESQVGVGTTISFSVRFDIDDRAILSQNFIDLQGKKILIVDDTRTNRIIFRKILEQQSALVYEAEDGHQALTLIEKHAKESDPFTLVLLDCQMPKMDGFTLAESIQGNPLLKGPLIMMLTSDNRPGDLLKAKSLKLASYLIKPILREDLLKSIESTLDIGPKSKIEEVALNTDSPELKSPLRILLIDDNLENRIVTKAFLKNFPWQIDEAVNGYEAISRFREKTYDLVLMDMQMPEMDGYTATKEIRRIEAEENLLPTPILALSAYALKEQIKRSFDAGCNDHLSKPIGKQVLVQTILKYTEPISFTMEEELVSIFPEYIKARMDELSKLRDYLKRNDFYSFEILAHRIKGAAGSFGLDQVSVLGGEMENLSSLGQTEDLIQKFRDYEQMIVRIYRGMKEEV